MDVRSEGRIEVLDKPEEVGLSAERLGRIEPFFQREYVDTGKLAGLVTLVARRGQVAHLAAFGQRDLEAGAAMETDTIFRIYSMTKPITSVALLSLYEEGRFQLDDPVSRFIPSWADLRVWSDGTPLKYTTEFPEREMQIRDLLTHTSGLTYGFMGRHPLDALYRRKKVEKDAAKDLGEMIETLADLPLLFSPGTQWSYSVATDVCGYLCEVISGQPFDRFLAERIFEPLGMVDTGFSVPADKVDRLAANYAWTAGDPLHLFDAPERSTYLAQPGFLSGGGGLVSTAHDYLRFALMLANRGELDGRRVLGRKTVEYMTRNHLPGGGDLASMGQKVFSEVSYEGIGFGLGVSVVLDPSAAGVVGSEGAHGWGGAASTNFSVDRSEELVTIILAQLMPSSQYPIRREMSSLAYQALIA
ncbi:MAG: serine hydrolase domain-containing protein [Actinomycetota bacterium]|nr:serine hydrolase domain-containing protein [Actinomycetota bacterium]